MSLRRAGSLRNLQDESEEVTNLDKLHDFETDLKKMGFRAWRKIFRDRDA